MLKVYEPSDFKVGTRFFGTVNHATFEIINIYHERIVSNGKTRLSGILTVSYKNLKTGKIYATNIDTLCRCKIEIIEDNVNFPGEDYANIINFIEKSTDLERLTTLIQLRSLWTGYCIKNSIKVDSERYDRYMIDMWQEVHKNPTCPYEFSNDSYDEFYNFMSELLF